VLPFSGTVNDLELPVCSCANGSAELLHEYLVMMSINMHGLVLLVLRPFELASARRITAATAGLSARGTHSGTRQKSKRADNKAANDARTHLIVKHW
jgi:hypothetical protein